MAVNIKKNPVHTDKTILKYDNGLPVSTQNAPTGASSNKAVQDDGQWASHLIGQNKAHRGESWALEHLPQRFVYDYCYGTGRIFVSKYKLF